MHNRQSIRFKGYDYSSDGFYFVTICTRGRECSLGYILSEEESLNNYPVGAGLCSALSKEKVHLSNLGKIISHEWYNLESRFPLLRLHDFVVMPNHIHGIIEIVHDERAEQSPAPTVGTIICAFKSLTTKAYNRLDSVTGRVIWQRNYWEHIIRDVYSFDKIADYINNNPYGWTEDMFYRKCH